MAKWTVGNGITEYIAQLQALDKSAEEQIGAAVYQGAKIVADEIRKNIKNMPTDEGHGTPQDPVKGVTRKQKAGLLDGLGIAKMKDDNGFIHVKIGMDGYNGVRTKAFPNGQPNALIIRSAETGSSFRQKTPVIAPAVKAKKAEAERKMAEVIEQKIKEVTKE